LKIILYIFTIFLFLGCSTQNEPVFKNKKEVIEKQQVKNIKVIKKNDTIEDEFEDGFEDEFEDDLEDNEVVVIDSEQEKTFFNEFICLIDDKNPLQEYNRGMTYLNDKLYTYILIPTSKSYKFLIHEKIRDRVSDFFENLGSPVRILNNLLQGKFDNSLDESKTFFINTTVGIFGLFDPAKDILKIEKHNEDFGQTLGYYGVGPGFHIVLPIFGPSNARDIVGLFVDSFLSPIDYTERDWVTITNNWQDYISVKTFEKINQTSYNVDLYGKMKKDAIDLYPYLRGIYEQNREKQIKE
jgi:phospholipid-binding lipoprotein MlaA